MAVLLGAIAVVGGAQPLAVALGAAYAVQVAPAVWTAWRTPVPSGIAASTWVMVVIECVLWAAYGVHHGDPATMTLGAAGVVAGVAMVARTATVRHRTPVVVGR